MNRGVIQRVNVLIILAARISETPHFESVELVL